MIYKNRTGYLSDQTLDVMDSAVRISLTVAFSKELGYINRFLFDDILNYEGNGLCVRCPAGGMPSENPRNFTRDQMMCLVAGLRRYDSNNSIKAVRRIFWACARRFFLAQNFERDMPGSKKILWPHQFWKDSKPNPVTYPKKFNWKKFKFEGVISPYTKEGITYEVEERTVDFADPLLPSHISHLISCGKMYWLYPFHLIGWSMLYLQLRFPDKRIKAEQNQIQCMVKIAGPTFVRLYKKYNPNWKEQTYHYWNTRNEEEYAQWIVSDLESSKYS